ncbi:hypothetical protein D3C59_00270 [Streptomyces sp. SHP22-7]|nr:hypothetical protein D3C59_00270 [Streptomyces sp. SHP22-7]
MTGNQIEALIGMLVTFGLLVLMVLPSVIGIVRDRRIDRQIREAQEGGEPGRRLRSPRPGRRCPPPPPGTPRGAARRSWSAPERPAAP